MKEKLATQLQMENLKSQQMFTAISSSTKSAIHSVDVYWVSNVILGGNVEVTRSYFDSLCDAKDYAKIKIGAREFVKNNFEFPYVVFVDGFIEKDGGIFDYVYGKSNE